MGVYDLQNPYDLEFDLNDIFNRLNQIFFIDITSEQIQIAPKITDTSNTFWASEENTKEFNQHIPSFKSLHKDMYAFIELTAKHKFEKYDISYFETKYSDYKEFRLLNNIIKHKKVKGVEISFVKIVLIESKQFDLVCNFNYADLFKCLPYSSFVILFLTILKDLEVIKVAN